MQCGRQSDGTCYMTRFNSRRLMVWLNDRTYTFGICNSLALDILEQAYFKPIAMGEVFHPGTIYLRCS